MYKHTKRACVQTKSGGDTPLPPQNDQKDLKEGGYHLSPETSARVHASPDEGEYVEFTV